MYLYPTAHQWTGETWHVKLEDGRVLAACDYHLRLFGPTVEEAVDTLRPCELCAGTRN